MMKKCIAMLFCTLLILIVKAQEISIKNNRIKRTLLFDGQVWRTIRFSDANNKKVLQVKSEEFNILPMNGSDSYGISNFKAEGKPIAFKRGDTSFLSISYKPLPAISSKEAVPNVLTITYFVINDQDVVKKNILLLYSAAATVDRLEVERFIVSEKATGGGRGEPVFINDTWFLGLEYPASYTRHTDGNTPASYARYYDKTGNYSMIDIEGRDIEPHAKKGMVRLMHFPGYAKAINKNDYVIKSKISVTGYAKNRFGAQYAFMQYLKTIWKPSRSFLHYNNWFDTKGKDLSGDAFVDVYRNFKTALSPYHINLDAMVVDDGWQNKKSVWDPSPKYFSNGYADVRKLSDKLHAEGTAFGLWLSIDGFVNDINVGKAMGYKEAVPNAYYKRFGRYYSVADTAYKNAMIKKIPDIAVESNSIYYKHDFNQLADLSDSTGHPPTDRHGHEACLDGEIEILIATKNIVPNIYQNLTNWIWFSSWWLLYGDYLWMLAGDDGTNGNWPELSTRAMATTDRDTYIWRNFGNATDRPLVPVSRLMTHGIIKAANGRMEGKEDNLQNWMEYVLMYYGRGTLLKEWYISPQVMMQEEWKALASVHNWAKKHETELNNTVFVGNRPDEGNAYGYIGWQGDKAVLVARNTNAATQNLIIPFNTTCMFYGEEGKPYKAKVVYPYQDVYPQTFISGKNMEITLPGYATMVLEIEKGIAPKAMFPCPSAIDFSTKKISDSIINTVLKVPANAKGQCDLLVIGFSKIPSVYINGIEAPIKRSSKALLNNFANYAKTGMASDKVRDWKMVSIDLLPYKGKQIEIKLNPTSPVETYIQVERKVNDMPELFENDMLWLRSNDTRRQTVRLY